MLNTKSDLLGWEGMRLRIAVREAQEGKASEASASSSPGTHTHGTVSNRLDCTPIAVSYALQLPHRYSVSLAPSHCLLPVVNTGCRTKMANAG